MLCIRKFDDLQKVKEKNVFKFLRNKVDIIHKHLGGNSPLKEFDLESKFGMLLVVEKDSEVIWDKESLIIISKDERFVYIPEWIEYVQIDKEVYANFCVLIAKNKVAEIYVKKEYLKFMS